MSVVGYQNYGLKEGLNLIAIQFNDVASNDRATVDNMLANLIGQACASDDQDISDEILTYDDGEGYSVANRFYFYLSGEDDPEYDYHWIAEGGDESGEVTTYQIAPGRGCFYWNRSGKEIATSNSGAVSPDQVTWTIVPNLNLLANPFPTALPVDTMTNWKAAGAYCTDDQDFADEILTYDDGEGYSVANRFYFYLSGEDDPEYDYHWIAEGGDESGEVTTYAIPSGKAFFYWRRGEGSMNPITLTSPVAAK